MGIPRFIANNKAFAASVVFSLGVGISAAAAVTALVDSVRSGPLPFHYADRVEVVFIGGDQFNMRRYGISTGVARALASPTSPFEEVALERFGGYSLRDGERQTSGLILETTPNYPRLLSARMHIGHPYGGGDPADGRYLVLSYQHWARNFNSDSSVLGRTVFVDTLAHTVVGVAAPDWGYPSNLIAGWASNPAMLASGRRRDNPVTVLGLRKEGIGIGQARAMITTIGTAAMTSKSDPHERIESESLRDFLTKGFVPLLVALGMVALFVGFITAVNFAALVLARGIQRRAEFGVRAALGASVGQIVRQIVGETVLLSAAGGVLAALMAPALLNVVRISFDRAVPNWLTITMSWRVVVFSVVASLVVGAVFSLGPALDLSRPALGAFLRATGAGVSSSSRATRSRAGLVSVQVALATAFLVLFGALLGRTLVLTRVSPGYDYEHVIVGNLEGERRGPPKVSPAVLANAERLPGVTQSAIANTRYLHADEVAFDGASADTSRFESIWAAQTTESFFAVATPTVVGGRLPSVAEYRARAPVAVITAITARTAFGDNAIGRTLRIGKMTLTVIGVIDRFDRDARDPGGTAAIISPVVEDPDVWTMPQLWLRVANGTAVPPFLRDLQQRASVNQLGHRVSFRSLDATMRDSMRAFWAIARIIYAIFGIALLLAAMGIYGLVSYTVEMRNREMAIREAVGASRLRVSALVLRGATIQTLIGVVAGSVIANAIAYRIRTDKFAMDTAGVATFIAFVVVSITVLLSSIAPLRSFWRRDLAQVLRD